MAIKNEYTENVAPDTQHMFKVAILCKEMKNKNRNVDTLSIEWKGKERRRCRMCMRGY